MPAFPLGSTFTKGLLGADDRAAVTASVKQAAADRAVWTGQIASKSYAEIERDPQPDGRRARDRPRPVRRQLLGLPWPRGQGQPWLPRPHARVVPVGQHARGDRRDHQGRHQLGPSQEPRVADAGVRPRPRAGAARYRERRRLCAEPVRRRRRRPAMPRPARPCSRRTAPSVTAPTARARPTSARPTSPPAIWTHGGDEASIYNDVWGGLQGQMPSWEGRLSPIDLKILALYIADLGKPRP